MACCAMIFSASSWVVALSHHQHLFPQVFYLVLLSQALVLDDIHVLLNVFAYIYQLFFVLFNSSCKLLGWQGNCRAHLKHSAAICNPCKVFCAEIFISVKYQIHITTWQPLLYCILEFIHIVHYCGQLSWAQWWPVRIPQKCTMINYYAWHL